MKVVKQSVMSLFRDADYTIVTLCCLCFRHPVMAFLRRVQNVATRLVLVSPPENDSFWKDLCFAVVFFFFFRCVISELCRPIGTKFCTMLGAAFNFIIPVQNFGGASPKNF